MEVGVDQAGTTKSNTARLLATCDNPAATEKNSWNTSTSMDSVCPTRPNATWTGLYCQPDFYYAPGPGKNALPVHVFCDGTPHDKSRSSSATRINGKQSTTWDTTTSSTTTWTRSMSWWPDAQTSFARYGERDGLQGRDPGPCTGSGLGRSSFRA